MRRLAIASVVLVLAACGRGGQTAAPEPAGDPLLAAALFDPIAADPDLASQNRANAVASLPALDRSVPSLDTGPDAVGRARADALALAGGPASLREAPAAARTDAPLASGAALSAAARAAQAGGTGACADKLAYGAAWAARLPPGFPVYPRGATQQAGGADGGGCALRVVEFLTPVPVSDVLDFYYTRATGAGFPVVHVRQGKDDVLRGANRAASFTVYARALGAGVTQVDLVTRG